jgi:hypothetical protein
MSEVSRGWERPRLPPHFPAHFRAFTSPYASPHSRGPWPVGRPGPSGGHPYTPLLTSGVSTVQYALTNDRQLQGGEQLFTNNKSTAQKAFAATKNRSDFPRALAAGRVLTPCSGVLASEVLSVPSRSSGRADSAVAPGGIYVPSDRAWHALEPNEGPSVHPPQGQRPGAG